MENSININRKKILLNNEKVMINNYFSCIQRVRKDTDVIPVIKIINVSIYF